MAQNSYITLQLEEVDGRINRELERLIQWRGKDSRLSTSRRRAVVCYAWCKLKAYCWGQATGEMCAEDIDEVTDIDGFADALLAAGYAQLVTESQNVDGRKGSRVIKIERFSPEEITKKNKLANDAQRKREIRQKQQDSEMSEKKRTHVREKSDVRPHAQDGYIYKIEYNKDKIPYNNNTSLSHSRYDRGGGEERSAYALDVRNSERGEDVQKSKADAAHQKRDQAIQTARENSNFNNWMKTEKPAIRLESLFQSEAGISRIVELVEEWNTKDVLF